MQIDHIWKVVGENKRTVPMKEADVPRVLQIEQVSFPGPWQRQSFMGELKNPHSLSLVIKIPGVLENNDIHAYSCSHIVHDELTILRMAVAPESRRSGLAGSLLNTVLTISRQKGVETAYLEVQLSNVPGRCLYQKFGFQVIGSRSGYYPKTGEDALVMMKKLKEIL